MMAALPPGGLQGKTEVNKLLGKFWSSKEVLFDCKLNITIIYSTKTSWSYFHRVPSGFTKPLILLKQEQFIQGIVDRHKCQTHKY